MHHHAIDDNFAKVTKDKLAAKLRASSDDRWLNAAHQDHAQPCVPLIVLATSGRDRASPEDIENEEPAEPHEISSSRLQA